MRTSGPELSDTVVLTSSDVAPRLARQWVRDHLSTWQLHDLTNACVLVTSELVTNAVLHGGPPVTVELRVRDDALRLDVADGSAEPPRLQHPDPDSESGRGLALALEMTDSISVEQVPDDGKHVVAVWRDVHARSR